MNEALRIETRERLGRQIRRRREEQGWPAGYLSQLLRRPASRISEIENGKTNATLDAMTDIGDAVDLALVFVPREKVAEIMALIGASEDDVPHRPALKTMWEELYVNDEGED